MVDLPMADQDDNQKTTQSPFKSKPAPKRFEKPPITGHKPGDWNDRPLPRSEPEEKK
jgi:hypothetical protein